MSAATACRSASVRSGVQTSKMNTTRSEAIALAGALTEPLGRLAGIDIAVCPPFVWLAEVGAAYELSRSAGRK